MNAPLRPIAVPAELASPHQSMRGLLRFLTCGSVDDGKSTLIGRLLFEAGAVPADTLAALDQDSTRHGTTGGRDYALLVDGLAAEREQGITIDVAYRYFATPRRAFIVADTPGHEQYTRNMATGASTADLAVILVDASKGILAQTRRHAFIVAMLGIRDVVLAVNKMDLVGHSAERFAAIEREAREALQSLGFRSLALIPLVARSGDNIAKPTDTMPWYSGPTLLGYLESIELEDRALGRFCFPVQWVNRPDSTFRGFAGVVASGRVASGDPVRILPSGRTSHIRRIVTADGDREVATAGEVPTLVLADEVDVSRGDVIVAADDPARSVRKIAAKLLWMSEVTHAPSRRLRIRIATQDANVRAMDVQAIIDIANFTARAPDELGLNAIANVILTLDRPVLAQGHAAGRDLGTFILVDCVSGETAALGVVADIATETGRGARLRQILARWMPPSAERPMRSILKALTWRATGSLDTFVLSWLFTGNAKIAAAISIAEVVTKLVLYYVHERAWARSPFGLSARTTKASDNFEGAGI